MSPDLDKYLERLLLLADNENTITAFPAVVTAICAVLREKREAAPVWESLSLCIPHDAISEKDCGGVLRTDPDPDRWGLVCDGCGDRFTPVRYVKDLGIAEAPHEER